MKNNNFSVKCPCCGKDKYVELRIEKADILDQQPDGYDNVIMLTCNRDGCGRTTILGYLKNTDDLLLSKEHPFTKAISVERVTQGHVTRPVKSMLPLY
jgi:hypothetical protein